MLQFYRLLSNAGKPLFRSLLERRVKDGKEISVRILEREGISSRPRPAGPLIWVHAASVGESQSALILVTRLLRAYSKAHILMTTGTVSSAMLMEKKLPERTFHQFYPADHPDWVKAFLDHWQPNFVIWMESELWPNMLSEIGRRNIPAALVNARLSQKSFNRWLWIKNTAKEILGAFSLVLAQSDKEAERYKILGARNVTATGNLKYSAQPLPCNDQDLQILTASVSGRPLWVFASTHKGEEAMACRIHQHLKTALPELLTIIIPRHPERREEIAHICEQQKLQFILRGEEKSLPKENTDIYIADTFGELGLFYRLSPIACIGRSFSDDGGGGHNPIEAAQLNCAVLHGKNVQYQQDLYDEMNNKGAAAEIRDEADLRNMLLELLSYPGKSKSYQKDALNYARSKEKVIDVVLENLKPCLEQAGLGEQMITRRIS